MRQNKWNPNWFQPTHGSSDEPLYKKWFYLKGYAKKKNIEFEWKEYGQFKQTIGKCYKEGSQLKRICKDMGYLNGNVEWVLKKPAKRPTPESKRRKPIKLPSEYSSNWWGF